MLEVTDDTGSRPKTGIVCTLGPSVASVEKIEKLLTAGMTIARFNFSHGTLDYHQGILDMLRKACENTGKLCAVALDTKGPEIRTGKLENGEPVLLTEGEHISITTDYTFVGNTKKIALSYPTLANEVEAGSRILMADGTICLRVLEVYPDKGEVDCVCENSAKLGETKNCNLPGIDVNLPILTEKDQTALTEWAVKNKIDMIFASFVQSVKDIDDIKEVLGPDGRDIKIVAKIESQSGIRRYQQIVDAADGIMVARGDLGMEIPMETIFLAQKKMIKAANAAAKPVITATQMLESMVNNPRPTRAEVTDVANAVLDGTDCVMLSGETAGGKFPIEAVTIMAGVCKEAETLLNPYTTYQEMMELSPVPMDTREALASSAVRCATKVGAKLIISLAASGATARLIAKYRPDVPILVAVVPKSTGMRDLIGFESRASSMRVARQALMTRGTIPLVSQVTSEEVKEEHRLSTDSAVDAVIKEACNHALDTGLITPEDNVICLHSIGEQDFSLPVLKVIPAAWATNTKA